jgi:lactocepin
MKFAPDSIALMRGDSGSVSLVGTYIVGGPDGIAQSPVGVDEATLTVKDSMVARIDTLRRMITAVGSGKTVITATDKRGGTTQMTVTVRAPYYVRVIPGASCGRLGADDHQYAAELYDTNLNRLPDEPVTWTSSDTSVATISASGLAHLKKGGTTNIVATIHREPATSTLIVDEAPLGTPMTCGGIFTPPSSSRSSWQTR